MARSFKPEGIGRSLRDELASRAVAIREKYGPKMGWEELQSLLQDREYAPFPCEIRFDAQPLLPGEFAHAVAKGSNREHGFIIYLHPLYATQLPRVPYLVLHQLVLINHGDSIGPEDAETFGSLVLGLTKDDYYQALCELSSQLGGDDLI